MHSSTSRCLLNLANVPTITSETIRAKDSTECSRHAEVLYSTFLVAEEFSGPADPVTSRDDSSRRARLFYLSLNNFPTDHRTLNLATTGGRLQSYLTVLSQPETFFPSSRRYAVPSDSLLTRFSLSEIASPFSRARVESTRETRIISCNTLSRSYRAELCEES